MTTSDSQTGLAGGDGGLRVSEAVAALRSIPFGGYDESTRDFDLPPSVRASVSPALTVLRWGAAAFGIAFAAPQAFEGHYEAVVASAICIFITTWRTVIPVRLASSSLRDRLAAGFDVVLLGIAVGLGGSLVSPFVFSLMVAMVVIAFGWGYLDGGIAFLVGVASMVAAAPFSGIPVADQFVGQPNLALVVVLILAVVVAAFVRQRLLDAEARRSSLAGEIDSLNDANELLALVNSVARTLPSSLTLREALDACRRQIDQTFDARVIALLAYDDNAEEWVPRLADGCVLNPAYQTRDLPEAFRVALDSPTPVIWDFTDSSDLEPLDKATRSGLYARLEARSNVVGVLALEHPDEGQFEDRHLQLMSSMAEVLALTIDNARWFGRLRTLGAEEERVRLARDLHDRLGQWLTYIGFELERIMSVTTESPGELQRLYEDVQSALDELRETLRQLRSGVSDDQPLAVIGPELLARFADRSHVKAEFLVTNPGERLPIPIENELFRILQEALNNISKHAHASSVRVTWTVTGGNFELAIVDDGQGFVTAKGVRESAFGLVGMRERADVVGAQLEIQSEPGKGTTIKVGAGEMGGLASSKGPQLPMGTS